MDDTKNNRLDTRIEDDEWSRTTISKKVIEDMKVMQAQGKPIFKCSRCDDITADKQHYFIVSMPPKDLIYTDIICDLCKYFINNPSYKKKG